MPSAVRTFRLGTVIVTLGLVVFMMTVTDHPARRWFAGGVLAFGTLQWLFLGALGRQFARDDAVLAASEGEDAEDSP